MMRIPANLRSFNDLLQSSFNIRYFLIFFSVFILCTMAGVLTHELGHLTMAEYLGYDTKLRFSRVDFENKELNEKISSIYEENEDKILTGQSYEGEEEHKQFLHDYFLDNVYIYAAGPVQTILTGTAGFMILFCRRNSLNNEILSWTEWTAVFLSFFWSRQVYLLLEWMGAGIIFPANTGMGDESYLSEVMGLWPFTITLLTGIIGIALLTWVIFRIIPIRYRTSFVTGGLTGSIAGHFTWLQFLGPVLLP